MNNLTYEQFESNLYSLNESITHDFIKKIYESFSYKISFDQFVQKIKSSGILKLLFTFFRFVKYSIEACANIINIILTNSYKMLKSFIQLQKKFIDYIKNGDKSFISLMKRTFETFGVEVVIFSWVIALIDKLINFNYPSFEEIVAHLSTFFESPVGYQTGIGDYFEFVITNTGEFIAFILDFIQNKGTILLDIGSFIATPQGTGIVVVIYLTILVFSMINKRTKNRIKKYQDIYY